MVLTNKNEKSVFQIEPSNQFWNQIWTVGRCGRWFFQNFFQISGKGSPVPSWYRPQCWHFLNKGPLILSLISPLYIWLAYHGRSGKYWTMAIFFNQLKSLRLDDDWRLDDDFHKTFFQSSSEGSHRLHDAGTVCLIIPAFARKYLEPQSTPRPHPSHFLWHTFEPFQKSDKATR